MFKRLLGVGTALALNSLAALAQNVPTRTLSTPDAEFPEPFTHIAGVRELKDGRLIVIDSREKTVLKLDLQTGTAQTLGREGSGPGEFGLPFRLLPLPNDTTAIVDVLNNRLLLINPNATVGGFVDFNATSPTGGRAGERSTVMFAGSFPTAADASGRLYAEGPAFSMTENGPQSTDSVPMFRWNRSSGVRETVAWLRLRPRVSQVSSRSERGNQQVTVRIGASPPFIGADQMIVASDGRVAIVHHDPYSVEYVSETGYRTRGQPIHYERQRITEGHKAEWREQQKRATGLRITEDANGNRSATMQPVGGMDPEVWGGPYMPPFLGNALNFSSDGYLWIQRTGPAGQRPTFDVINRAGNLAQKVVLPERSRVIGFGKNAIYVIRLDDDDLQYLQKYAF